MNRHSASPAARAARRPLSQMRTARSLSAAPAGDKREAIMRAATKVFARSGYFNSKVADVAREAGVADGTVYLYFKSKEEILRSIFERNTGEAVRAGREELAKIEDPREKLRRIARHHLERLGADRDLAVVFQVELRGTTKFMEEFSAAKLVAKILFGALDEMATNWILSKRRYKLAPMADEVLDIFLGGVNA